MTTTTVLNEFVQKVLSNEQQFSIDRARQHMLFTQVAIGTGKCVFGDYGYDNINFISDLDTKLIPYAIVSNGDVYVINQHGLNVGSLEQKDYPNNTYDIYSKIEEYNKKVTEFLFPAFYESLPITELNSEDKGKVKEAARNIMLSNGGKVEKPVFKELISKQKCADILYGLIDFEEYVKSYFEGLKDSYINIKSFSHEVETVISKNEVLDDWEMQLNNALRELEGAKTVTVEFMYKSKEITDRLDKERLLRKLNNKDYFTDYDFSTSKQGDKLLKYLEAGQWRDAENEVLTCKHISKITYGRKVVYSKE